MCGMIGRPKEGQRFVILCCICPKKGLTSLSIGLDVLLMLS
jgi:hypothetical protein